MQKPLHILHLEDLPSDAGLIERALRKDGLPFDLLLATDRSSYIEALRQYPADIILSDHSLPGIDSFAALQLMRDAGLQIPFILITSATSEEIAVEVMKAGAWDYILKDRMQRLPSAVRGALEKHAYEVERRRYIDTVIAYNERFQIVSKATNDAIWDWDILRDAMQWNHGIHTIFGYDEYMTESTQTWWKMKIHPNDLDRITFELSEAFRTRATHWTSQYQYRCANGEYKYVLDRAYILYDQVRPVQMIGAMQDISQQKQYEIAIRKSEALFRALVENSGDVIGLTDQQGQMKYISPSVTPICGYTPEEFLNLKRRDLVHPDDQDRLNDFLRHLLLTRSEPHDLTFRLRHRDGHWQWMEGTAMNLSHIDSIGGAVANFRDITTRKNNEDEKNTLVQQLQLQNENLIQYSYIVSHNLRGPVARMLGLIDLIQREPVSPDVSTLLGMLHKAAFNLDEVIKDLTKILEIKSQQTQYKEWVDMAEVLQAIRETLSDQLKSTQTQLTITGHWPGQFYSIKSYLYSILYNLISNAIKYRDAHRPPHIIVNMFYQPDMLGFTVEDNGIGIDLDRHSQKIFKLYQRFNLSVEGKGLGLYLIKTQVTALNGTIQVESHLDKGTRFTVTLPIDPQHTSETTADAARKKNEMIT